jgi:hypothetical protein
LKKKKEEAEVKLAQIRSTITLASDELIARQLKLTTDKKGLLVLDTLIHGLKG